MRTYSEEQKARLVERMLPPQAASVPQLSLETGIPRDTLYDWRRQALRERGLASLGASPRWSAEEKFTMVVEAATLSEAELGEYCWRRGVYPEQLAAWRKVCAQANGPAGRRPRPDQDAQADKQRIRERERELSRKDKALAEAAALLVLRKKAQAILKERARTYD